MGWSVGSNGNEDGELWLDVDLAVAALRQAGIEDSIYRPARSKEEAMQELETCTGADFDPHVDEAFIRVLKEMGEV